MESEKTGQPLQFAVSISADRDHFQRRTCPSCGLDFKTGIDRADLQWALSSYCRRAGLEIGEQAGNDTPPPTRIRCPYCEHEGESREMFTEETLEYVKRIVYREYVYHQINNVFSGLEDASGGNRRRSGGMFSVSLEFKHTRPIQPVRPIHGPEPADFKIVTFLCCGKKIKVSEAWNDVHACSFCGTEVVIV